MGKDYVIVDFSDLDPERFSLLPKRENGFGGYSAGIRYDDKKLYVRYRSRQCRAGVKRWSANSYSIGINLTEFDPYLEKAGEIDSRFMEGFGPLWTPIVSGEYYSALYFKIPVSRDGSDTKFFGKSPSSFLLDAVPRMSNICILALWDTVSAGCYGVVIRPKAIQVNVVGTIAKDYYDDDGPEYFLSEEVRKFESPILYGISE